MENTGGGKSGGIVWMVSTFALIGILIGLGISSLDGGSVSTTVIDPTTGTGTTEVVLPDAEDDAVLGDANAPVTIIMFSDYECPACYYFETEIFPLIKADFIDTGKIKFIYRDFPLVSKHPMAHITAEAAECADDYSKYYEYQDLIVANYDEWSTYEGDINQLLTDYAATIEGIDTTAFKACLDDGKYYDEVEADMSDGRDAGVQGTPSFFINGQKIQGVPPYEDYVDQDGQSKQGLKTILTQIVGE
ncbi:MAG: DsbA family protein [Candidatus Gracilibacteria bacterium]